MEDVKAVCRSYALDGRKTSDGSQYVISHPARAELLTIPLNRPLKAVYIKLLVGFIKAVEDVSNGRQ